MRLETCFNLDLGQRIGQCRAALLQLADRRAIVAAYAADFDVDPYIDMFFFPTDTLKLAAISVEGELLWKRDLGRSVVPGVWFCPVFPFDLDGDGVDEIYYVNNRDANHPLALRHYVLERVDAVSGRTTGQWPWPADGRYEQSLGRAFRYFILGGYVHGQPVLVAADGTYAAMNLRAYNADMSLRWHVHLPPGSPGSLGSHMTPVVDLNNDGVDEFLWGERCISLDDGRELFCADRDVYRGHSDVIQPLFDRRQNRWFFYTIRESDPQASPRVVLFDDQGQRVWGDVDHGHMDMGWVARLHPDGSPTAMAIRIGQKSCGPDGRFHKAMTEFCFDARTGAPRPLPFSIYQTLPVDLDGDGVHELVRGIPGGNGDVLDGAGRILGNVGGTVAMLSHITAHPGEQLLTYAPDGTLRLWRDADAVDRPAALARYAHPVYRASQRLTAVGYNLPLLGGI